MKELIKFKAFKILKILVNKINHKIAKSNYLNNPQLVILAFDHIGLRINLEGRYENDLLLVLKEFLKEKLPNSYDLALIDIGANIGNHSIFFSELFKKIYAFEPNPLTYEILKINSNFNVRKKNISTYKLGLSDKQGKAFFQINRLNMGSSRIIYPKNNNLNSEDIIEIEISYADKIEELKKENIGCIKIDIEGHEFRTLIGAENIIKRNKPIIIIEQNKLEFKNGSSKALNFLKKMGYSFYIFNNDFYFGEKIIARYFSFIINLFVFRKLHLKKISKFNRRNYEMIVAIYD